MSHTQDERLRISLLAANSHLGAETTRLPPACANSSPPHPILPPKQLITFPPILIEKLDGRLSAENGQADLELGSLGRGRGDGVREGDVGREEAELLENGCLVPADVLVAGCTGERESKVSRARR